MPQKKTAVAIVALAAFSLLIVATTRIPKPPAITPCSEPWFAYLEAQYMSPADRDGHGPDRGSQEWLYAFERRMNFPEALVEPSSQRCQAIQRQLETHTVLVNSWLGAVVL